MCEANAMGNSVPSGSVWEITAPTQYAEASVARLTGRVES